MTQLLLTEKTDCGILTITLNRPDKLNALNHEVLTQLSALFRETKEDNSIKAILITGLGKAFCAGADISRMKNAPPQAALDFAKEGQTCFNLLENLGKPSIAAINGYAFGGGCELAMSATLRIACQSAKFSQPEVKLGIIPGYGGTQRLARLIGLGRAMDLCITGRTIDANQALQWGLVTECTEPDQLQTRSLEILNDLSKLAPMAIASIIDTINTGYNLPLIDALDYEAHQFSEIFTSKDSQEGIQAFLEKRPASFTGE